MTRTKGEHAALDRGQLRTVRGPGEASTTLVTSPGACCASPESVGSGDGKHACDLGNVQFCCCHFADLVPELADTLRAAWGDVNLLARLVEQLLGGETAVQLDNESALEFVHLYMHLDVIRTAPPSP